MFCKIYIWLEHDLLNPKKFESLKLVKYFSSYGLAKFLIFVIMQNGNLVNIQDSCITVFHRGPFQTQAQTDGTSVHVCDMQAQAHWPV